MYVIWGSTYLAIRWAVETLPPFGMAGVRFVAAGAVLYAWQRARGAAAPTRREWRGAAVVGCLLLLGGNGGVVWAERTVPSGLAALVIATVPLWMVGLEWALLGTGRPGGRMVAGIAVGLLGIGILLDPFRPSAGGGIDPWGAAALVGATLAWATGSILSRRLVVPAAPLTSTAAQMLAGGAALLGLGAVTGEVGTFDAVAVTTRSVLAVGYLAVFGSLVGFSAYVWLLQHARPAVVATYAYVNPVVAVALGCALNAEPFTPRMAVAAGLIIGAVVLITTSRARPPAR